MNGGSLCHRVIEPAQPGAHPVDARDRDDASRSRLRHYRHGVLHRGKSAADVNGDRRVEPVEVDLGNADPLRTRPGIVDYAIDPDRTKRWSARSSPSPPLRRPHRSARSGRTHPEPAQAVHPFAPTSGYYDPGSLFNEQRRSACADAARSAGDDRDLAFKRQQGIKLRWDGTPIGARGVLSRSGGGLITFQVIEPGTTVFYDARMAQQRQTIGGHLREWRQRRRMSQLDLACEAGISTRHLSFVETGRALPSRDMLLHLAEQLGVPMRDRNVLLVAAGYAPIFPERSLRDPALAAARAAIDLVLDRQKPYPAFALDGHWCIAASNNALPELYTGVAPELLEPPVNGLRLSLHPRGMAPRIVNLAEWRAHLLFRLRRQIEITADPVLIDLLREVGDYPTPADKPVPTSALEYAVVIPFKIQTEAGLMSFFSTTTIFGTPVDVTLSELALELFFPADDETVAAVQRMTGSGLSRSIVTAH